jgi:hypothetical protein
MKMNKLRQSGTISLMEKSQIVCCLGREEETGAGINTRHVSCQCLPAKLLILVSLILCLCGCATTGQQLYQGPAQPQSEVVTVMIGSWLMFMQILIDEKWAPLHSGSTVLPGTYKVACLCNCRITDSAGPSAKLEAAGFPHFGQAEFPDSFTATAGDTVTFLWSPGMRVLDNDKAKLMG